MREHALVGRRRNSRRVQLRIRKLRSSVDPGLLQSLVAVENRQAQAREVLLLLGLDEFGPNKRNCLGQVAFIRSRVFYLQGKQKLAYLLVQRKRINLTLKFNSIQTK